MAFETENIRYLFPVDTKIIHFNGSPDKYSAILRSRCKTKEEFRENWLKEYEKISKVSMRVLLTRPKIGKTVVYKASYRCQHNTYPKSHQRVKAPHRKHTGCPAVLKVTVKASPENRTVRSIDKLRREFPTIINVNHDHNHNIPNQGFSVRQYITKSEFNCDGDKRPKIENEIMGEKNSIKEDKLDWDFLKNCWNSFLDNWKSSNSKHLYKALLKATFYLENCKTVNSTIAALNSVGNKFNKKNMILKY